MNIPDSSRQFSRLLLLAICKIFMYVGLAWTKHWKSYVEHKNNCIIHFFKKLLFYSFFDIEANINLKNFWSNIQRMRSGEGGGGRREMKKGRGEVGSLPPMPDGTYISIYPVPTGSCSTSSMKRLLTDTKASSGHSWNQSIAVQLVTAGNLRLRTLSVEPTGEKQSTT